MGQAFSQLYPDLLKGFISIDSVPLQRKYITTAELWLLKRMEPVYAYFPWKLLLKSGSEGVAVSDYGRKDHAGSCIRYNKAWHRDTHIPLQWIEGAGHNSNTDKPEQINALIEEFLANIRL